MYDLYLYGTSLLNHSGLISPYLARKEQADRHSKQSLPHPLKKWERTFIDCLQNLEAP